MDSDIKIIKLNNTSARLLLDEPLIMRDVYNYMAVYAENYKFMPKYKAGVWDGKIPFMTKAGVFPIGLLFRIVDFLKQMEYKVLIDKRLTQKYEVDDFETITESWLGELEEGIPIVPRPWQIEGALELLKFRNGILEHATSSGKSLTIAMIIQYLFLKNIGEKALILVPTVGLVNQMSSDLISYGVPKEYIGKFYSNEKSFDSKITISTWQSMLNQPELAKTFDIFICDEVHNTKGPVIRQVADSIKNASIRIGCTGSIPDPKSDLLSVLGSFGPIRHVVTTKQLIEAKQASDIIIKIPYIKHSKSIKKTLKGVPYDMEKEFLEKYAPRNHIIKHISQKHIEKGHNILILVDHIDHGKTLFENISKIENIQPFFVYGNVDPEERERIRKYVNTSKSCAIIATYQTFSTGININRLHAIIFASAGKSKIRSLQSIGRGLRLHREKNYLILYDIGDDIKYSSKHLQDRIKIYTKSEFNIDTYDIDLTNKVK